jgi:hypothetical protein
VSDACLNQEWVPSRQRANSGRCKDPNDINFDATHLTSPAEVDEEEAAAAVAAALASAAFCLDEWLRFGRMAILWRAADVSSRPDDSRPSSSRRAFLQ